MQEKKEKKKKGLLPHPLTRGRVGGIGDDSGVEAFAQQGSDLEGPA